MDKPISPPIKIWCDACGDISKTGKHTSWGCRFIEWFENFLAK
jgi:hypothetical protein